MTEAPSGADSGGGSASKSLKIRYLLHIENAINIPFLSLSILICRKLEDLAMYLIPFNRLLIGKFY